MLLLLENDFLNGFNLYWDSLDGGDIIAVIAKLFKILQNITIIDKITTGYKV